MNRHTIRPGKLALVQWAALYPILTLMLWLLGPLLAPLPLALRTLVVTAVLVPLMSLGVMPRLKRWLRPWLEKRSFRASDSARSQPTPKDGVPAS